MPNKTHATKTAYNLYPDLKHLPKIKAVINPHLLPFINFFMKIAFRLKSDKFVNVKKYKIATFQNGKIDVFVIEPKNQVVPSTTNDENYKNLQNQKTPALVIFHGGAFCLRASNAHYKIAKEYARRLCCKVIYADYRLLPKYPFPCALKDCFETYKWTRKNSEFLQIDSEKIIIAGDSAGGNLAIGVTLHCKKEKIPLPKATLLIYPVTDRRMQTYSMKTFSDTPVWNAKLNKKMWQMYLQNKNACNEKLPLYLASPMENENFEKFPKTYIEVAEIDCLRDEGIDFAEKLKASGADVELVKVERACHGFETATKSKIVKDAMDRRVDFCENVFR